MQWEELFGTFKNKWGEFFFWLAANLGGLLISYIAALTLLIPHQYVRAFLIPGQEVFLVSATISVAITGVSHLKTHMFDSTRLNPWIAFSWPFILMAIYGILISLGAKEPIVENYIIWIFVLFVFILSMVWCSIVWLNENGLESDAKNTNQKKPSIDPKITSAAENLPKIDGGGTK